MKHCQAAVAPAAQTAEDARRKKNREAARLCRLKKKQRQQRLKEAFQSLTERNRHLSTIAEKLGRLYAASLAYHASQSAFLAYLKRNPGLVRDPDTRPLLQHFMGGPFHRLLAC
ncbi:hypothetical protein BOX15_Mlig013995g4 [Macrostomum lignano]|uniref:BZIP domain-containing protein n=3 Tax=Macrostomum lignano TaxID=282301 RepID=A0A1I8HD66_9PLAT|nr:hypothetical protein BOX15_Mlig013995g4 [Macrostomum lignano]